MGNQPVNGSTPTLVERPATHDPFSSDKHRRYNTSARGRQRNTSRYMQRPFIGWDGEGIKEPDGSHTYTLLSSSDGRRIYDRLGISTEAAFELMLDGPSDVINVIYGGGYDINMILKDVDRESLTQLYLSGRVRWNGYHIEWRQGKSFSVKTMERSFLLYDILPFFQRSFVAACDEYLGPDWEARDQIIEEKARRGSFTADEYERVMDYNNAELRNLVRLAVELRERLHRADIHPSRWDGPGAIANALYRKYKTKSHLPLAHPASALAIRTAYAGGRFEIVRKGHRAGPVWQYDINSAYPSAARNLPCLSCGYWRYVSMPTNPVRFGVYRVEVTDPPMPSITQPQPLWMRNKDGTVFFARYTHGWYWTPEVELALELGGVVIHEGWEWVSECDHQPFHFVEPLYLKRLALKKAGDGAQVSYKLGLNSLYGKLAQQLGWEPGPPLKLPPYHTLEWAGYITSHCRANVLRAALQAPDDVIAFETDAVFMRVPLDLPVGDQLGEWSLTEYESITYLKSGMYWATKKDGKEVEKTRGFNKGTVTRADVIDVLARDVFDPLAVLRAKQTRFVTLGQALHQDFSLWRRWVTSPRVISVALNGKRIDLLSDSDAWNPTGDGLTETQEGFHSTTFSYPYPVEWLDQEGMEIPYQINELRQVDLENAWSMDHD